MDSSRKRRASWESRDASGGLSRNDAGSGTVPPRRLRRSDRHLMTKWLTRESLELQEANGTGEFGDASVQ